MDGENVPKLRPPKRPPGLHALENHGIGQLGTEDTLPFGDNGACQAVSHNVHRRASHVHQRVDAENDEDGLCRQMKGGRGGQEHHQRSPWPPGDPLAGEHQGRHHQKLLTEGQMNARGLRHKDAGYRKIERGPVQIEAVPGRDDERHHATRHAERLHGLHGTRQRGFTGRRGERDRSGLRDSGEKSRNRDPEKQRRRQQYENAKQRQRPVQRQQELAQVDQHAQSHVADRVRHGRPHTDGGKVHHHVGEPEHDLRERFA